MKSHFITVTLRSSSHWRRGAGIRSYTYSLVDDKSLRGPREFASEPARTLRSLCRRIASKATNYFGAVILGLACQEPSTSLAAGCELEWSLPATHFEDVDAGGFVCHSEKIGDADFGDGLKLPLIINFRSDRETVSPYLGAGWILALLESNFVQISENVFQMTLPDGSSRLFLRRKVSETSLNGGYWKAEINGDTITAWASGGWKLSYSKGHLISISTDKNRQLELVRSGNKVVEIREGGSTRLAVEFGQTTGLAKALRFNGKRWEIVRGQKPQVQVVAGQNVIVGLTSSLQKLSTAEKQFEFAVDDKVRPTLKIVSSATGDRLLKWDPGTKRIVADGDWTYQVGKVDSADELPMMQRRNSKNQTEYWLDDIQRCQTTSIGIDGIKEISRWFGSGKMAGKLRKIERVSPDGTSNLVYRATYDENGDLIRAVDTTTGVQKETVSMTPEQIRKLLSAGVQRKMTND